MGEYNIGDKVYIHNGKKTEAYTINKSLKGKDCIIQGLPALDFSMKTQKTLSDIFEDIEHFKNYLKLRIEIISNNPNRWLGSSFYELPKFEYYLKNCIEDKGGKYDFTRRNYGNQSCSHEFNISNSISRIKIQKTVSVRYSMWMGTPFNYETLIN